jgi:hypothetical protein
MHNTKVLRFGMVKGIRYPQPSFFLTNHINSVSKPSYPKPSYPTHLSWARYKGFSDKKVWGFFYKFMDIPQPLLKVEDSINSKLEKI